METDYKTVRYMMPESHKRQYNTKLQLVQNNQRLSDVQRNEILFLPVFNVYAPTI